MANIRMNQNPRRLVPPAARVKRAGLLLLLVASSTSWAADRSASLLRKLDGFDGYMQQVLRDWNCPGIAVGVVVDDRLVLAKGYGLRDYGQKLPFTPRTLFPIASNTKLFTAVAAGMLVEAGDLTWDSPVRQAVPSIRFYDDALDNTITLRDMLSHRTGITRHDTIWAKSDFTNAELFDKLRYLEPSAPPRQEFIYNNLMYAAAGHIIELKSGRPWRDYVREKILQPLEMPATVFSTAEMQRQADQAVPYTERRDSRELYRIPYFESTDGGVAPAGGLISNVDEISHWLIALMNEGKYAGRQVLPAAVLKATLQPAIALPNGAGESRGWWESLNSAYGMGRWTASYRGHLLAFHGGDVPGFHSQISYLPVERIGVIVLIIGDHAAAMKNAIGYQVYERLLGMSPTPWSRRLLDLKHKDEQASRESRAKAGATRVAGTQPSHRLEDYAGEYEHPAYGLLQISLDGGQLQLGFHKRHLAMTHYHYDRFDTADDEQEGKWSLNFRTNPQGELDQVLMSIDEAEAVFVRRPPPLAPEVLARLTGTYRSPSGSSIQIVQDGHGQLMLREPVGSETKLLARGGLRFGIEQFSDVVYEFVEREGRIVSLKRIDPAGEEAWTRE